jgi:membrane-bound lytic murein transglycosylase D
MRRSVTAVAALVLAALSLGAHKEEAFSNGIVVSPPYLAIEASESLPVDPNIAERVRFWIDVYAKYNSWQLIVHDKLYPQIIYGVADSSSQNKRATLSRAVQIQERARAILVKLQQNQSAIESGKLILNEEEDRIYKLFANISGKNKFADAADPKRFRRQGGLKDSLLSALHLSGRYLPRMEKVFARAGLPTEIAYLPFVESSFNKEAVSKVGASGIWQIMPGTGRDFMRVDEVIDERNDPMRAAEAAAKLMRQNFEALGNWPLAITAYNHGRLGMARAIKTVGTLDLSKIIDQYDGPSFGFASANFYSSFLAAKHVAQNHEHYLGSIEKARILEFDEFVVPDYVSAETLVKSAGVPEADLKELNPALSDAVWQGRFLVPIGYNLRVPLEKRDQFLQNYDAVPDEFKFAQQKEDAETGARQISSIN